MRATKATFNSLNTAVLLDQAYKRMQRHGEQLERIIGPEGSYAPIGRSMTSRKGMAPM